MGFALLHHDVSGAGYGAANHRDAKQEGGIGSQQKTYPLRPVNLFSGDLRVLSCTVLHCPANWATGATVSS